MPITFVGTSSPQPSTGAGAAGTAISANTPAGVTQNDLLLWPIGIQLANVMATPTNWLVWQTAVSGTALSYGIFYRFATSSEPAAHTHTISSARWVAPILAYRGVDTTTPKDAANPTPNTGTTTEVAMPSITTVTPNAWVLGFRFATTAAGIAVATYTTATGNLRESITTTSGGINPSIGVADHIRATAGAFAPDITSTATRAQNRAITSALRPADGGGTATAGRIRTQRRGRR